MSGVSAILTHTYRWEALFFRRHHPFQYFIDLGNNWWTLTRSGLRDIAEKIDGEEGFENVPFVSFEPTAVQKRKAALLKEQKQREQAARNAVPEKRKPFSKKHHW